MAKNKSKRSNAPSATYPVKSGDADARKYASFGDCGGTGGDPIGAQGAKKGGVVQGLKTEK